MKTITTLFNSLIDILLPRSAESKRIAAFTLSDLSTLPQPTQKPTTPRTVSLFSYKDERVRTLIWQLKYRGDKRVAHLCGRALAEHIWADIEELSIAHGVQTYALVPIPISKKRLRERGFNQCELLAQIIAKEYPDIFHVAPVLVKTGNKEHQARMRTKALRIKNIRGTFSVKTVPHMPIIIIDDVTTTGATIEEAMRVLHEAGAKDIRAFTFAH